MSRMKCMLRWAGGKGRVLKYYEPLFPKQVDGRLLEPMCGGAALSFTWAPRFKGGLILGDANAELMATYNWLKCDVEGVVDALVELGDTYHDLEDETNRAIFYNSIKAAYNSLPYGQRVSTPVRAAYFIFLNRTSFNGLYRVNRSGEYNTPFGKIKKLPDDLVSAVKTTAEIVSRPDVQLYASTYEWVLQVARPGDVVYFDPPFDGTFTAYTRAAFGSLEQACLRDTVDELTEAGVAVFVASSDTPLIRELYQEYAIFQLQTPRSISCKGDDREPADELLIVNGVSC